MRHQNFIVREAANGVRTYRVMTGSDMIKAAQEVISRKTFAYTLLGAKRTERLMSVQAAEALMRMWNRADPPTRAVLLTASIERIGKELTKAAKARGII